MAGMTPPRSASPAIAAKKAANEARRKSLKPQSLSPRAEAERQAKAARVYVAHVRAIEAAAAKHALTRGPPTTLGTNADDKTWLESNATAPGVITLPCGLQYRVLRAAKVGAIAPKSDTPCEVHYRGKVLRTDTEFHCSWKKSADPERHVPNKCIQGWTVALQLMGVGDKWMLWVASELAYGDTARGSHIPPGAALTFEIEMLAVRSEQCLPKVPRPKDEQQLATAMVRPSSATPKALHAGGASEVDLPLTRPNSSLFERMPVLVKRGNGGSDGGGGGGGGGVASRLSDRTDVSQATGEGAADGGGTTSDRESAVHMLRAELAQARRDAAEHQTLVSQLRAENVQLRASLQQAEAAMAHALSSAAGRANMEEAREEEMVTIAPPLALPVGATPTRSVVLVGVTGGGKSSIGCSLVADVSAFGVSSGFSSMTATPAHSDYASLVGAESSQVEQQGLGEQEGLGEGCLTVGGRQHHITRVIDTVGLQDSSLPAAEAIERFLTFTSHVPPGGIDLFLFVLPFGRFSAAAEAALDAFVACVGEGALEHTILVFTRTTLSHQHLKQELAANAPPSLRRIIPRLAFPSVLGVDTVVQPNASLQTLRCGVDEAIEGLAGERYSRETIAQAQEEYEGGQDEVERAAFASAVSDWRRTL